MNTRQAACYPRRVKARGQIEGPARGEFHKWEEMTSSLLNIFVAAATMATLPNSACFFCSIWRCDVKRKQTR